MTGKVYTVSHCYCRTCEFLLMPDYEGLGEMDAHGNAGEAATP
jgi:hypothetical protein